MNTYQYIESIQQVFPQVSKNQIRLDLDTAQKILASEISNLTTKASLSSINSNFAWVLPSDFLKVEDLTLYDVDGNPKYLGDYNYGYEIELGKLFIYSKTSVPITGLSSEINTAYLHYRQLPTSLSTENTSMEITEQFRDACESYVLGKYFSKFPIDTSVGGGQIAKILNLSAAQLHKNEYEKIRIKLKKFLGSQIKTSGEAQFYDAGNWQLPKRPDDLGSGTILPISSWATIYSKYAYFSVTGDGSYSASVQIGYTTISAAVSGDTLTVRSTGEFDITTMIMPSNWDATWTRDSSSQYTFTLPSGWTSFALEIYEK